MSAKRLKKIIISGLIIVFSLAIFNIASAQNPGASGGYNFNGQSGLDTAAGQAGYATSSAATSLTDIIGYIVYAFLGLVSVIFLGLIIYGGVIWMTAQGNEEKVKEANNIIMSALFGLIISLAAYVISYFVISYFG